MLASGLAKMAHSRRLEGARTYTSYFVSLRMHCSGPSSEQKEKSSRASPPTRTLDLNPTPQIYAGQVSAPEKQTKTLASSQAARTNTSRATTALALTPYIPFNQSPKP